MDSLSHCEGTAEEACSLGANWLPEWLEDCEELAAIRPALIEFDASLNSFQMEEQVLFSSNHNPTVCVFSHRGAGAFVRMSVARVCVWVRGMHRCVCVYPSVFVQIRSPSQFYFVWIWGKVSLWLKVSTFICINIHNATIVRVIYDHINNTS